MTSLDGNYSQSHHHGYKPPHRTLTAAKEEVKDSESDRILAVRSFFSLQTNRSQNSLKISTIWSHFKRYSYRLLLPTYNGQDTDLMLQLADHREVDEPPSRS